MIIDIVEKMLEKHPVISNPSLEEIFEIDKALSRIISKKFAQHSYSPKIDINKFTNIVNSKISANLNCHSGCK